MKKIVEMLIKSLQYRSILNLLPQKVRKRCMVNIQKFSIMLVAEFLDSAAKNVVNKIADWSRVSNNLPVQQSDIGRDSVLKK